MHALAIYGAQCTAVAAQLYNCTIHADILLLTVTHVRFFCQIENNNRSCSWKTTSMRLKPIEKKKWKKSDLVFDKFSSFTIEWHKSFHSLVAPDVCAIHATSSPNDYICGNNRLSCLFPLASCLLPLSCSSLSLVRFLSIFLCDSIAIAASLTAYTRTIVDIADVVADILLIEFSFHRVAKAKR